MLGGGFGKSPPRQWWLLFGVALVCASGLSYLYGRVSCQTEMRRQQATKEALDEVNSAKSIMLRLQKVQAMLAANEAAAAAAAAHDSDSEQKALLSDLAELKGLITARHASHQQPTATPGASLPALEKPANAAVPHGSHVHGDHGAAHSHDGGAHAHGGHTDSHDPKSPAHTHQLISADEPKPIATDDTKLDPRFAGKDPKALCAQWKKEYHVVPGSSWGHLTAELMTEWTILDCDHLVGGMKAQPKVASLPRSWGVSTVLKPGEKVEIMAVCVAVVTRTINNPSIERLALFRNLLPSFKRTAMPGFEYRFYVAYDIGDPWFDNRANRDSAALWFAENVGLPLASTSGVNATIFFHSLKNELKKPGPAFNSMTRAAYRDGAHWIYRINDDSILDTPWAHELTGKLKSFGLPFGTVGPWCTFGNTAILTHDMTHRTHMEIFDDALNNNDNEQHEAPWGYYPPQLNDWWMDDWITRVYGRARTRRLRDVVVTHNSEHGTRYMVDHSHGGLVDGLVARGRQKVVNYMKRNGYPAAVIDAFQADTSEFSVVAG